MDEFIKTLPPNMNRDRAALLALFEYVSREGPLQLSDDKSKFLRNGIREFRAKSLRVLWFYDDNKVVVCSHAFAKSTQKTPPGELEKAEACKKRYFEARDNNDIEIIS